MVCFNWGQSTGYDRAKYGTDYPRDLQVHTPVKIVQEADNKGTKGAGPHTKENAMMDSDNHLKCYSYNYPYKNTKKNIRQDDGFSYPLGAACPHNLHDDNKHGATQYK